MNGTKLNLLAEAGSTEITRFNALRHGVLSRYTVLPWEDAEEYSTLIAALAAEHAPQGPTEEHLAGILWRKRRLRLAEAAAYHRGLDDTLSPFSGTKKAALAYVGVSSTLADVSDAISVTATDTEAELADMATDEAITRRALDLLGSKCNDTYEAALAGLHQDTRDLWADELARDPAELEEDEMPATANVEGLHRFLEGEVLPWFETREGTGQPAADPRAGVRRGARSRKAGAARAL